MVGHLIADIYTVNTAVVRFVSNDLIHSLLQFILNEHQYKNADICPVSRTIIQRGTV